MKPLNEYLLDQVETHPHRTALTFLEDGDDAAVSWSCYDLAVRASAIAAELTERACFQRPVLLFYPSGLEYIAALWGCLLSGAIAVPAFPPRANSRLRRLETIVSDSTATIALTSALGLESIEQVKPLSGLFNNLAYLVTDSLMSNSNGSLWRSKLALNSPAIIQYTSGSTTSPKGVVLTHDNVIANEAMITSAFGQTEDSIIVGWLPLHHDMGLLGQVIQPLLIGARCIFMTQLAFLQKPLRWLAALSRFRGTTSGGPTFAYKLCVDKIDDIPPNSLDLSCWKVAFNGAEPIRSDVMKSFADKFFPSGFQYDSFYPCYGLAEATLLVSARVPVRAVRQLEVDSLALGQDVIAPPMLLGRSRTIVSSGMPAPGCSITIVNHQSGAECLPGSIGEICVAGPHVSHGYWLKPTDGEQSCANVLLQTGQPTFMRTGDLGFIDHEELFVTGRLKDLLVIRGVNHYPQDIEATASSSHKHLASGIAAAFSISSADDSSVVLLHEVERHCRHAFEEIIDHIWQAVSLEHGIALHAIYLVRRGTIPVTSSGKVQRFLCKQYFETHRLRTLAGRTSNPIGSSSDQQRCTGDVIEGVVLEWLSQAVGSPGYGSLNESLARSLSQSGVDSLKAAEIASAIDTRFGVSISVHELLSARSLNDIAGSVVARTATRQPGFPFVSLQGNGPYSLSIGQQALWFIDQSSPGNAAYTLGHAVRLTGRVEEALVATSIAQLVERHPLLRSSFSEADGVPFGIVHADRKAEIFTISLQSSDESSVDLLLSEHVRRPFNLRTDALLRVGLCRESSTALILFVAVPHIIADLWSLALLLKELGLLYAANEAKAVVALPQISSSYADYTEYQRSILAGAPGQTLGDYWLTQLSGDVYAAELPTDRPRPGRQTFNGAVYCFGLGCALSVAVKTLAREQDVTPYIVLLSALQVVVAQYTRRSDFLLATPVSGRGHSRWDNVFGYFANPVVLRARVHYDVSMSTLFTATKSSVVEALQHQELPFQRVVQLLNADRDTSRSPLFQIMFSMNQTRILGDEEVGALIVGDPMARVVAGGLVMQSMPVLNKACLTDVEVVMSEVSGSLSGFVRYNSDLFNQQTIEGLVQSWFTMLERTVADASIPIGVLAALGGQQLSRVLTASKGPSRGQRGKRCLHQLVEAQAAESPGAIAVTFGDQQLTYSALNDKANQLARELKRLGVGPEAIVVVCLERSLELVTSLLAILKAGGAYLPIDPSFPPDRVQSILKEGRSSIALVQKQTVGVLSGAFQHIMSVDDRVQSWSTYSTDNLDVAVSPLNAAYLIYTSGSTGRPKGVVSLHDGICNRLRWMQEVYRLEPGEHVLHKTSIGFDVSVWELFWPLITGAIVCLARQGGEKDPAYIANTIRDAAITTVHFVPSMLRVFLDSGRLHNGNTLRRIICSGETLDSDLCKDVMSCCQVRLANLYGPTEASVDVTSWECPQVNIPNSIPIGKPAPNVELYVLDERLSPVPLGVVGHVYLGGIQLARGYWERPELTADKFLPNPWASEPGSRLYDTGDLGRYNVNGDVEFLGRDDDQIKLRGHRIELGDISAALRRHPLISDAVAFCIETTDKVKGIAAFAACADDALTDGTIRTFLRTLLPEYMVPTSVTLLKQLPLTQSGKVDRAKLLSMRREFNAKGLRRPRTDHEEIVCTIWSDVLDRVVVDIDASFFDLGGHSLLAIKVITRIRALLGVDVPVSALFGAPTVRELAQYVQRVLSHAAMSEESGKAIELVKAANVSADCLLSHSQKRLWFEALMNPRNSSYNLAGAVRLQGQLDLLSLRRALAEVVGRHDSLRTCFEWSHDEEPRAIVTDVETLVQHEELDRTGTYSDWEMILHRLRSIADEPFDLQTAPLFRCVVLKLGPDDHILLVSLHHIISDGWSLGVIVRDLTSFYESFANALPLPTPSRPLQYSDYTRWEHEWMNTQRLDILKRYWEKQLRDLPPALQFPFRPTTRDAASGPGEVTFVLKPERVEALRRLCQRYGLTSHMLFLSAFDILLYFYTKQSDLVVGCNVANRSRLETEGTVGFFVNLLPIRISLAAESQLVEIFGSVRQACMEAYSHQDLPFDYMVALAGQTRHSSRFPLFQVKVDFARDLLGTVSFAQLDTSIVDLGPTVARYELQLVVTETGGQLGGSLIYQRSRFDETAIASLVRTLELILELIADNVDISLKALCGSLDGHLLKDVQDVVDRSRAAGQASLETFHMRRREPANTK